MTPPDALTARPETPPPDALGPDAPPGGPGDATLDALALPALDVVFRNAERVDRVSAWFGHIPFAHWLVRAARPRVFVELGTHAGLSYTAFCQAVEAEQLGTRCYAVDTWQGDEHAGLYGEDVYADLAHYHDVRFAAFSQLLRCTFDEAAGMFADGSVDLLHIDGLHTYDAVKHDFENWLPKLSDRAVVLFHDTNERLREFGVWKLWAEVAERWPAFEFVHGHGLGVLCVGGEAPEAVRALCALPPREAAVVRARFARLGERWEAEYRAVAAQRLVAERDARIAERDARIAASDAARAAAEASRDAQAARADAAERAAREAGETAGAAETARAAWAERAHAAERAVRTARDAQEAAHAALDAQAARAARAERAARETREAAKAADVLRFEVAALREGQSAELARLRQRLQATAEALAWRESIQAHADAARDRADAARARAEDALRETREELARERAARAVAEAHTQAASHERDALLSSTAWRATWPARRLAGALPVPLRRHGRRAAKAAWWAATPWTLSRRLRRLRDARQRGGAVGGEAVRPPALAHEAAARPALAHDPIAHDPPARADADPARHDPARHDPSRDGALDRPAPERGESAGEDPYALWIREIEPLGRAPLAGAGVPRSFAETRFSFLIAHADRPDALAATLDSLRAQANPDWELLIAAPPGEATRRALPPAAAADARVRAIEGASGTDAGERLASLLQAARGAWVGVLDAGDVLAPDALDEVAHALAHAPDAAILYGDEDELSPDGRRRAPRFKPAWSPELLQAYNYFGRLTLLSRPLALQAGGFVAGQGAGAEWGLNLRAADAAQAQGAGVRRIARVLCHRAAGGERDRPAPTSAAAAEHRAALRAFWRGRGIEDPRVDTRPDGTQRSTWDIADPPLVSVVIPNHNSPALLRRCVEGILDGTDYRAVEVIVVENRSSDPEIWPLYDALQRRGVRVIRVDAPFNYSAACNRGAAVARGALLLFLNNDIEVVDPGWLGELVRVATLPGVGVVGTKLRYPTGELQHAGVAVGVHLFGLMYHRGREGAWGVFGSTEHTRNWSAVMGACQMVRREVFDRVGGFDEAYRIANSDVALCLRAQRAGWRTAYTPFAALVHHEGTTRGRTNPAEDMALSAREVRRLGIAEDPYLHPGLSAWDPVPRLRAPGEPDLREELQRQADRYLAAVPPPEAPLDPFDDGDAERAAGLPRPFIFWPPQPAPLVRDRWSAARWVLDLLRGRPDLRARFPRALSEGEGGAFAAWLAEGGGGAAALSPEAGALVQGLFRDDPSARARQTYFWRDDLRAAFPLGLLPPGRRGLAGWLLRNGPVEEGLRPEEIWWFVLRCAEDPAGEFVRTYLFTPAWQHAHPYGLTPFGRDALAAWVAERYGVSPDAGWLDPATWPVRLPAAEQIRLAYFARDDWRTAHPDAFATERTARALLDWLAGPEAGLTREAREWCAERAADGTAAVLATPGANVIAHFCYPSGLRVSAEAMCDGMEAAGACVSRRDMRTDRGDDPYHGEFGGLEPYDVTVVHTQPEPFFEASYPRSDLAERTPRTHRIAYWYWELDAVPAHWAETARTVDEVWAATTFVADALRQTVSVPVRTLFPGVRIGPFTPRPREAFGLRGREDGRGEGRGREGGRFAFLFSFHMGSVMERKNPLGLIRAFKRAFGPDEPVDLVLKTTSFGRADAQVDELVAAAEGANISVLDRVLTPDETLSLMDACDAYVSLHRSEGLGLTMAEAMLLGKPVVATRYSGNMDFMDDGNSLLVDYELVPLGRPVPPYDAAARWANPSTGHAARLMRRLYEDRALAAELGAKARADALVRLSPEAAGRRFAARLAEIKATRWPIRP